MLFVKKVRNTVHYLLKLQQSWQIICYFAIKIGDTNNDEFSYLRIKQTMKSLITKSDNSKIAADILAEKGLYCNCIQCYYYSMLQLSKAVLIQHKHCGINVLDDISADVGSHNIIIKGVTGVIEQFRGCMPKNEYRNAMLAAKRIRISAAYTSKIQTEDDVATMKDYFKFCNKLLDDTLKI